MKPNKIPQIARSAGSASRQVAGKFMTKVATPEQVRKANILLTRLKEEANKSGWMPYYPTRPEVP